MDASFRRFSDESSLQWSHEVEKSDSCTKHDAKEWYYMMKNEEIGKAMTIKLEFPNGLPKPKPFQEGIRRLRTVASV